MQWMAFVWLVLMVGFLFLETGTVSLVSIWFAVGALSAMIASLFSAPIVVQGVVFLVVSCICLAALRPLFRKFIQPKLIKTNVESVPGSVGIVIETVNNLEATGQVKLEHMVWSARSTDESTLEVGTQVRVDRIEGVKVFVSPVEVSVK